MNPFSEQEPARLSCATQNNKPAKGPFDQKEETLKETEMVVDEEKIKKMRKRVCFIMVKYLESSMTMDKIKARNLTFRIELRIREMHPDYGREYKDKILLILKLVRVRK